MRCIFCVPYQRHFDNDGVVNWLYTSTERFTSYLYIFEWLWWLWWLHDRFYEGIGFADLRFFLQSFRQLKMVRCGNSASLLRARVLVLGISSLWADDLCPH